jgi:hypothetical protein
MRDFLSATGVRMECGLSGGPDWCQEMNDFVVFYKYNALEAK